MIRDGKYSLILSRLHTRPRKSCRKKDQSYGLINTLKWVEYLTFPNSENVQITFPTIIWRHAGIKQPVLHDTSILRSIQNQMFHQVTDWMVCASGIPYQSSYLQQKLLHKQCDLLDHKQIQPDSMFAPNILILRIKPKVFQLSNLIKYCRILHFTYFH